LGRLVDLDSSARELVVAVPRPKQQKLAVMGDDGAGRSPFDLRGAGSEVIGVPNLDQ